MTDHDPDHEAGYEAGYRLGREHGEARTSDNGYATIGAALRAASSGQTVYVIDGRYIPSCASNVRALTSPLLIKIADQLDEIITKIYPNASVEAEEPELLSGRKAHGYFLEMVQLAEDLRALAQP